MDDKTKSAVNGLIDGLFSSNEYVLSKGESSALPDKDKVKKVISLVNAIVYPNFFSEKDHCTKERLKKLVDELCAVLKDVVTSAVLYASVKNGVSRPDVSVSVDDAVEKFVSGIPEITALTALDVKAMLAGDPAADSPDIIMLTYPGPKAIFVYRVAHFLYKLGVPLVPRMMTEIAHSETGIDIHPGATIGKSFVIDHGTGVVIGETAVIGDRVKLYQGVTLGAKSLTDARSLVGVKRHPTLKDNVTVYSGATILGGETVIGEGAVIGSSVFITSSVPDNVTVAAEKPKLRLYKNNPLD